MKFISNIRAGMLCLLIAGACFATNNKRKATANKMADAHNDLLQVKNTNGGSICVQLMPATVYNANDKERAVYCIRITLKINQPIKQTELMHYMNFGIRDSFYATQGTDTLSCVVCERIPGISGNEFLYMTCFAKPGNNTDNNLRISITGALIGFGITTFEINKNTLTELEAIK